MTYERKVRFSDTDAQGVVFNGMYATYFDDTITDYFDAIGVPWETLNDSGYDMVLARVEIDFRSSGRLGDVLITGARVKRIGNTSLVFELRTWDEASGRTVAEAVQVQVIVDHTEFKPVPVPVFLSEAVVRSQGPLPNRDG